MRTRTLVLLTFLSACQPSTRAQDATPTARPPIAAKAPAQDRVENRHDEGPCDGAGWRTETVSDPSGYPSVAVQYPNEWQFRNEAPSRVMLTSSDKPFQFVVSVLRGPTQTDAEVKALDAQTTVGQQPAISDWQKLRDEPHYRVFGVTRRTPGSTIVLRYYAGTEGLVVASFETIDALDPTTERQSTRALTCLKPIFK